MSLRFLINLISLFFLIFSRDLNQTQKDQIDNILKKRIDSAHLKNFGIVIVNSASIIHQKVFGGGINIKTPFPIGSVTKSITALGILKLNISLNETIDNFNLGEFIDKEDAKKITVKELMSHSSGLDASSSKITGKKGKFLYSNYGYGLLGKIIADKSEEKDYGKYIKKHIFDDDLNMTNSGTNYNETFMDSYVNFLGFFTKYGGLESDYENKNGFDIPAGYARSTIEDMGKYLQSFLNGINNDYLKQMGEPKTNIDYNLYYGMGLFIRNKNGKKIYDHSGVISSFLTHLYIYPDDDLAYFIFTNTRDQLCQGPFYRLESLLENLITNDVNSYEETLMSPLDSMDFFTLHFTIDVIILIIIAIPLTYLIITIVRKIKKKKPTWFNGVKGIIVFIVDILLLIILPVLLLVALTNVLKSTKDFIFTLLTATITMMVTFILKLVYFFIYRKYWKDLEDAEDIINKKSEHFELGYVNS